MDDIVPNMIRCTNAWLCSARKGSLCSCKTRLQPQARVLRQWRRDLNPGLRAKLKRQPDDKGLPRNLPCWLSAMVQIAGKRHAFFNTLLAMARLRQAVVLTDIFPYAQGACQAPGVPAGNA